MTKDLHFNSAKQRNPTNPKIGGMSSAQKQSKMRSIFGVPKISNFREPPVNWRNSEHQKPRNVITNDSTPPVSDGWFLTFKNAVSALSKKAGFPVKFTLTQLKGGRNNRIFCINYEDGKRVLLKAYFQHQNDKRTRIKTEYSFLNFAWNSYIRCVPKPISADFENNIGLYEFIEGRKLAYSEIDKEKINHALDFFIGINKHKDAYEAQKLPAASDSCFSIQEHINHAARRIERLKAIDNSSEISSKARKFVHENLMPEWDKALAHLNKSIQKYNWNAIKPLMQQERCISPSDFGYHNAILGKNNKLYFIDFEYAGFDDPAKMACDFFCQPEVPVPSKYLNYFANEVAANTLNNIADSKSFKQRIDALLPLYRVKWCCIMLNDFLDVDSERRNFAFGGIGYEKEKINQLEKAKSYARK